MARPKRYFVMPEIDQPDPEPGFQHNSDEFIIPATDEEGGSERIWCRVPGQLHGWLSSIVASGKFPFVRDGDLIRYGIYLACVQLSRIERSVPNLQKAVGRAARTVREREAQGTVEQHLDHLGKVLSSFQRLNAYGEILRLLAAEKRDAEELERSEPFWGKFWREKLEERHGMLRDYATAQFDQILKESPERYVDLRPSKAIHEAEPAEE